MDATAKKTLNLLLDKYERSKSFNDKNKVNQSFFVEPAKIYPKYSDDSEYEFFVAFNEAMNALKDKDLVNLLSQKNGVIQKVILNMDQVEQVYSLLGRPSKKGEIEWLNGVWEGILSEQNGGSHPSMEPYNRIINKYIANQRERIEKNKSVAYYENDRKEYKDLLTAVKEAILNKQETYMRDFSIRVFSDSKRMEGLKAKVQSFLFEYGDYMEKEHVLEECGIVSTPTYVAMKGNAILELENQKIDLSLLNGDIALSTESIKELTHIRVLGNRVVTIENMTSFHDYPNGGDFLLYLGGFHNKVKREMIQFIYSENQAKQYCHFGDIDAGGFYIYEHLCNKTGIYFHTLHMNLDVLKRHKANWKGLSRNDKRRIKQLIEKLEDKESGGMQFDDYRETLYFMMDHDCKLEQEALKGYF